MPRLTRWYIRTALVYLAAALLAGIGWAARDVFSLPAAVASLWPVYVHLLTVGWLTQLIFGVAFWMFPRYSKEHFHGSIPLAWATYVLLNVGLVLRVAGEPLHGLYAESDWGWLLAASAVLQLLAGIGFVVNTWARVRER